MFVVGGETQGGLVNSVYVLNTDVDRRTDIDGDGTTELVNMMVWTLAETSGDAPAPRKNHAAVLLFSKLYIFGGVGEDRRRLNDVHVLDTETLTWSRPELTGDSPDPRDSHTMTLFGPRILVFGGWDGKNYFSDISSLDPKTGVWQRLNVSGAVPAGRKGHSATLIAGNKLYVFGGSCADRRSNELFVLDTGAMHWTQPEVKGNTPLARAYHTATMLDGKLFVFGGLAKGNKPLVDFRSLDTGFYNWSLPSLNGREPDLTRARGGHTACFVGAKLFFFGGTNGTRLFNDLLAIDTESEVKKQKQRYQFMKETYPGIFDAMQAGKVAGKKKVYWQSGLPFIPEIPFSHTVYTEFPPEGQQNFTGKEAHFFMLTDWSKWRQETVLFFF